MYGYAGSKKYIYGTGLISEQRADGKKYYYHYNNIGSTTDVTDALGAVVHSYAYGTYGELMGAYDSAGRACDPEETDIAYLYNGEYGIRTEGNGLYYMRSCYYNPQIKRFINRDVVEGSIKEAQSLNRYSYVQGNPISLTDPFGMCAEDRWKDAGHNILDVLGFAFDAADILNALWYFAEGDYKNAAFSSICMLPLLGSFAGKGLKATKLGSKADDIIKALSKSADNVKNYLRKLLKGSGKYADEAIEAIEKGGRGNTFKSRYDIPINESGYTKSSFELGRKVYKEYKAGEVDNITKFKEYILPSGKRVDYIDFESKTVYELKPHNPKQIKKGRKQLENYLKEIEKVFGGGWKAVLDTY